MSPKDLSEVTIWRVGGDPYTREDLMAMEPVCLRALFRERVHHTIEVNIYPILLGRTEMSPDFGMQTELLLDVCTQRGFNLEDDDFVWGLKYIELARKMRNGEEVAIEELVPEPFSDEEMKVVRKLLWGRKSVRDWVIGKPVPDELIEQVLEAGRAAPTGCNLDVVRFAVIKTPEEAKMVFSDIPTPMEQCVLIVVCYDHRVYQTVGHDGMVPHNQGFDSAAAGDHMCLMAHALGLGAVWLTCTEKTAATFQRKYGLPDYIKPAMHIALGWPAMSSLKSGRMPLSEYMLSR